MEEISCEMNFLWGSKVLCGTMLKDRRFIGTFNTGTVGGGGAQAEPG